MELIVYVNRYSYWNMYFGMTFVPSINGRSLSDEFINIFFLDNDPNRIKEFWDLPEEVIESYVEKTLQWTPRPEKSFNEEGFEFTTFSKIL